MKVFLTGATGYIGGSVGRALADRGHEVRGLVRTDAGAQELERIGVRPVRGNLSSWSLLIEEARAADAVINAADADDAFAISALLTALEGSEKPLIHTSGSSIVGDMAAGEFAGPTYTEDSVVLPRFEKAGRVAIDRQVLAAAPRQIRSVVICPTMIYGLGTGPKTDSIQIPWLIALSRESGAGRHVGSGRNIWSNVHIDDLVELYLLALESAQAGSFFFAEQGEAELRDIAVWISNMLGFGGATAPISIDEAALRWGSEAAHFAFGSNSRVSAEKARRMLNWSPKGSKLADEIESGCYRLIR
jgi:nucleoside-diphosphate-sugar epimerase